MHHLSFNSIPHVNLYLVYLPLKSGSGKFGNGTYNPGGFIGAMLEGGGKQNFQVFLESAMSFHSRGVTPAGREQWGKEKTKLSGQKNFHLKMVLFIPVHPFMGRTIKNLC